MPSPYILSLDASGASEAITLEGLPTRNEANEPIHYRRVNIAKCGDWVHCGTGQPLNFTPERMAKLVDNSNALIAAGRKPFASTRHIFSNPDAKDTLGDVVRLEQAGDGVSAIVALHGDEALKIAARNGRSVGIKRDALDAKGNEFDGEWLHHLAFVPNPALPDLGGMVRIAASADGPAMEVPVYTPAAAIPERKSIMKPELAKQFRDKLGIAANVPDEQLADLAAQKALALSADVQTLTTERDTLKQDRDAKAQEVIALSADNKMPDAMSLSLIQDSFDTCRNEAIKSGVISESGMKQIDAMLLPEGKPSKTALALSSDGTKTAPFYKRLCKIIAENPGIKTGNDIPRDVTARAEAENAITLQLSGDGKAKVRDRQADLLMEQLGTKKTA